VLYLWGAGVSTASVGDGGRTDWDGERGGDESGEDEEGGGEETHCWVGG
jgi:hypothetical protein